MTKSLPNPTTPSNLAVAPISGASRSRLIVLGCSILAIAPIAIFVHTLMLYRLGVPYPSVVDLPKWARVLAYVEELLGVAIFCRVSALQLQRFPPAFAACAVAMQP